MITLRTTRPASVRLLMRATHRAFFSVTAGVVWLAHRPLLRRAGYDARSFLRLCQAQYAFYLEPVSVTLASSSVP